MNAARLSNSDRLRRVARLLKSGKTFSTLQIVRLARVVAVSSIVAELRSNGMNISCTGLSLRVFRHLGASTTMIDSGVECTDFDRRTWPQDVGPSLPHCSGYRTSGHWKGWPCAASVKHYKRGKWWCKNHLPLDDDD